MALARGRRFRQTDAWPGYVDVLSTLVLVVVFVLSVFVLAQFFLAQALSGKDRALEQLTRQLSELGNLLSLEQRANADLRASIAQLSTSLAEATAARDQALAALAPLQERAAAADRLAAESRQRIVILEDDLRKLQQQAQEQTGRAEDLARQLATREERLVSANRELEQEKRLTEEARSQVDLLNRQLLALRQQLARLEAVLQAAEQKDRESQAAIADLGRRLNLALAQRTEELARYRSEFFGRLREALGSRQDIEIVGDRFVFRSEVLFPAGSADLSIAGQTQLTILANTLKEIVPKIPRDLPWVLRIDGHTDRVPIRTAQFPSNWELSTARATNVVKYLVDLGLPPNRLAAAGFGEFQPREDGNSAEALSRNRRIEFKLTDR